MAFVVVGCGAHPGLDAVPAPGSYRGVLVHEGRAWSGPVELLAYQSVSPTRSCSPTDWVELRGLCDLTLRPHGAFATLDEGESGRIPLCRFADRGWRLIGGEALVELGEAQAVVQIVADEACTVEYPLGVPPVTVCRGATVLRLELQLEEGSATGVLDRPVFAGPSWDGVNCGPALHGLQRGD